MTWFSFKNVFQALLVTLLSVTVFATTVAAETQKGNFDIQLNSVKNVKDGCRMTLVMHNGLGSKIDTVVFNLVLFDTAGTVSQSLSLNAGKFLKNKTHVHQFDMKSLACEKISRVLVNDISQCEGGSLVLDYCREHLSTRSAIKISLIQ